MLDAHVHLDFMSNGEKVAAQARADGCILFASTVTPAGYSAARERFAPFDNVIVGLGLHPWWVEEASLPAFEGLSAHARYIGEVGLDFGKRHANTRELQTMTFSRIARLCAEQGDKVLSIHSVHAARDVLDTLEAAGTLETCTCVFHWFTGPSDQLKRAIESGCWFSVGARMLATGKGREYVKAIPNDRLLLETDAPPEQGQEYSYRALREQLEIAAQGAGISLEQTSMPRRQ